MPSVPFFLPRPAAKSFFCLGAGVIWSRRAAQRSGSKFGSAAAASSSCSALYLALLLVVTDDQALGSRNTNTHPCCRLECAFLCLGMFQLLPPRRGDKRKICPFVPQAARGRCVGLEDEDESRSVLWENKHLYSNKKKNNNNVFIYRRHWV